MSNEETIGSGYYMGHTNVFHIIQEGGRTWGKEDDFKMGMKVVGPCDRATGVSVDDPREGGLLRAGIRDSCLGFRVSQSLWG